MDAHNGDTRSPTNEEGDDGAAIEDLTTEPGLIIIRKPRSKDPDPLLLGNVMAMAFPGPASDERIIEKFTRTPATRPSEFAALELTQRFEYISRLSLFHHLFQPHIDFVHKVVAVIRASYIARDPRRREVIAFLWRIISGIPGHLPRLDGVGAGGGLGILVIGPGGNGKTSLVDRLVEYLRPMARIHLSLDGRPASWRQLSVVKISVDKTWRLTLLKILTEADRQLEMDHYSRRLRTPSVGQLQQEVWAALTAHFCPILILDEFQTLGELTPKDARDILGGLVGLMEGAGIPVMVVGTVAVKSMFERYRNYLEKFSNEGADEFGPLLPDDPASEEIVGDAQVLLHGYKALHVSRKEPRYAPDFDIRFMAHTMGVPRVMREYFKAIHRKHAVAEEEGRELAIDGALLQALAANAMSLYEGAMDILRKRRLGFPISAEDWKVYEHNLEPEEKPTTAQLSIYIDWTIKDNDVGRTLPVDEYMQLRRRLSDSTRRDRAVAASDVNNSSKFEQAATESAVHTPLQALVQATRTKVAVRRAKRESPSDVIQSLEKNKKRSLELPPQGNAAEGPSSIDAGDLA